MRERTPLARMVAAVRTFLTILIIVAVAAGALALYLYLTTPHETVAVRFPLTAAERAAIARVPASADAFVYVPRAAQLQAKLTRNPMTRALVQSWRSQHAMPQAWILGGADLIAWQSGKENRYLLRLDRVRQALVRLYLAMNGDVGRSVLINGAGEPSIEATELDAIEALSASLPPGDALVVQRERSRAAFPPIGRPSVSSVQIGDDDLQIASVAPASSSGNAAPLQIRVARSAILSASFATPPRMLGDINRLFGNKVSDLLSDGGSIALYDIDTRKLLPRPLGVITFPATGGHPADLDVLRKLGGRSERKGSDLVIAFDDSIDTYLRDAVDGAVVPGGRWAVRIDAERMMPILDRLRNNIGLRIASPRLFRAARDLDRWLGDLQQAKTIDATASTRGSFEELKVRATTK